MNTSITNIKVPFKLFVASSFRADFLENRKQIQTMVDQLNQENLPFNFELYRYESDDTNTARQIGAQLEINQYIDQSHGFILLCDNNVGKKTVEEFEHALSRFKSLGLPPFIAIYQLKSQVCQPCGPNQITFTDFDNRYLTLLRNDINGKTVLDKYVYEFSVEDNSLQQSFSKVNDKIRYNGINALLTKFRVDLKEWITKSPHRPLFQAVLGHDVKPDFLYSDPSRHNKCKDNIYFHRNIDDILYNTIESADCHSILIQGDSLSGKTRALYQAIKGLPNAWYYKFSSDVNEVIDDIHSVVTYLKGTKLDAPMFLILDDIHLLTEVLDSKNSGLKDLWELLNASQEGNQFNQVKLIATATTNISFTKLNIEFKKVIKIQPMSNEEYFEAQLFCQRNGIKIQTGYRNIGAMMINLQHLATEYNNFLNDKEISLREKLIRRAILRSIHASSIWRNSSIGDARKICNFALFVSNALVKRNQKDLEENERGEVSTDEVNSTILTIARSLHGIVCRESALESDDCNDLFGSINPNEVPIRLQIEEYIYRYIINYDGSVLTGEAEYNNELKAISVILSYVAEYREELIITTLSKVARRSVFRSQIAKLVYHIVMCQYNGGRLPILNKEWSEEEQKYMSLNKELPKWYKILCDELQQVKLEIEANPDLNNEEASLSVEYLSKILTAMMHTAATFDEAYDIFATSPKPLQSLAMLAALIDQSEGEADKLQRIKELDKYKEECASFYIIARLVPYCNNFSEALKLVQSGQMPFKDNRDYIDATKEFAASQRDDTNHSELFMKHFNRSWYITTINNLAHKVSDFGELEEYLSIIRKNYVLLLDNIRMAERFESEVDIYNRDNLTVIDLFARLSVWSLKKMFENLVYWHGVDNDIPWEITDYLNRVLYVELDNTLDNYQAILKKMGNSNLVLGDSIVYTPRYKAKNVVSFIINTILNCCVKYDYRKVFNEIFIPMLHTHLGGKTINLRDSFSYAAMIQNKNCSYIDAIELYRLYIKPHSKDIGEHFRISHLLLNRIISKVKTIKEFEYINSIFDDAGVTRDIYTYNSALSILPYDVCAKKIIPQMYSEKVEFDSHTLGHLITQAPNIKIAAGYFKASKHLRIPCQSNRISINTADGAGLESKVEQMIDNYTNKAELPAQHYLWANLFLKSCLSDSDRDILSKFLDYLEGCPGSDELFANGIIHNNCLKNNSFIRNYDEAKMFIKQRKVKFDSYTFMHLQNIIINEFGDNGLQQLNELYRNHKDIVVESIKDGDTRIYNTRMRLYLSFTNKHKLIFIDKSGKVIEKMCTPLEYLQTMIDMGIPVDMYTIDILLKIKQNLTINMVKELAKCIKLNKIYVSNVNIIYLFGRCQSLNGLTIDEIKDICDLPVHNSQNAMGWKIVTFYAMELTDLSTAFDDININLVNSIEKLYCYTQLIKYYRIRFGNKLSDEAFDEAWNLYLTHIKGKTDVNIDILSSLANLTYSSINLEKIIDECKTFGLAPNEYLMSAFMRSSNTYSEVKYWVDVYFSLNGRLIQRVLDTILQSLAECVQKRGDSSAKNYITKLAEYLLRAQSACAYPADLADFPCFEHYAKSFKVTYLTLSHIFRTLDIPTDSYLDIVSELLNKYHDDNSEEELLKALQRGVKKRKISDEEVSNLLKPYPNMLFKYPYNLYNITPTIYNLLVDEWQKNFDSLSSAMATRILTIMAFKGSINKKNPSQDFFRSITKKLMGKLLKGITFDCYRSDNKSSKQEYPQIIVSYNTYNEFNEYYIKNKLKKCHDANSRIKVLIDAHNGQLLNKLLLQKLLNDETLVDKFDYAALNTLLQSITEENLKVAVLQVMAAKIESYGDLWLIIDHICNFRINLDKFFYSKLIDRILHIRHEDIHLHEISNQVLTAIDRNELSIRDFIRGRQLYHFAGFNIVALDRDKEAFYKMLNNMYVGFWSKDSETLLANASDIVVNYYADSVKQNIDSAVVQALFNIYVQCYNKHDVSDRDATYLKPIEELLSLDINGNMNISTLFSQEVLDRLNKPDDWYIIPSRDVSRMVLIHINSSIPNRIDQIIRKSRTPMHKWLKSVSQGKFELLSSRAKNNIYKCATEDANYISSADWREITTLLLQCARTSADLCDIVRYILNSGSQSNIDSLAVANAIFRVICNNHELLKRLWKYGYEHGDINHSGYNNMVKYLKNVVYNSTCLEILKSKVNGAYKPSIAKNLFNNIITTCEACGCSECQDIVTKCKEMYCDYWRPDAVFLKDVLEIDTSDITDCDAQLARIFDNNDDVYDVIKRYIADSFLFKNLYDNDYKDAMNILSKYVNDNYQRFQSLATIDSPLLIATYINKSHSLDLILRGIWEDRVYNSSYFATTNIEPNIKVFTDVMTPLIFRELSKRIESRYKKKIDHGFSTTLLFHKLIVSCGINFIIEDDTILSDVANTITTEKEYISFINDLKTFSLPMSPETTEATLRAAMRIADMISQRPEVNHKRKESKKSVPLLSTLTRLRAYAELSSFYPPNNCKEFSTERFDPFGTIDENNRNWLSQTVWLPKDSAVLKSLSERPIHVRLQDLRYLPIQLRYLTLVKMYDTDRCKELENELTKVLYMLLVKISSPENAGIPVADIRKIVIAWRASSLRVPSNIKKEWFIRKPAKKNKAEIDGPESINTLYALVTYLKYASNGKGSNASACRNILASVDNSCRFARNDNVAIRYSQLVQRKYKEQKEDLRRLYCPVAELRKILPIMASPATQEDAPTEIADRDL